MKNFRQVRESSSGVLRLDVLIIAHTDFRFATFTVGTSSRGMSDLRTRAVKLTPSLGLTNSAVDLRPDSMASRAIPSRPQSAPRCYRTGHWHRNLKVLRISLWRLARQKRGLLLEALPSRSECPAGNAVSTHGCGWSSLCTSMKTDSLGHF